MHSATRVLTCPGEEDVLDRERKDFDNETLDALKNVPPPAPYNSFIHHNTWGGFKHELLPLPPNFDIEINEYVLMYKEFIIMYLIGNNPLLMSMMRGVLTLSNFLLIEVVYV